MSEQNRDDRAILGGPWSAGTAAEALKIVLALLTINIVVDLGLRSAGLIVSTNSAVPLGDMFSDFFRFVISFSRRRRRRQSRALARGTHP